MRKVSLLRDKMVKAVFVIAPEGFKDIEYIAPKKVLEDGGVSVVTASLQKTAIGSDGAKVEVDILLTEVDFSYDGIVFVGGPGSKIYFNNTKALELAKGYFDNGKVVGAICIAPVILGNAGILKGKKATVFSGFENNMKCAECTGANVEVDGKIVTSSGPFAAEEFGEKLLLKLRGE